MDRHGQFSLARMLAAIALPAAALALLRIAIGNRSQREVFESSLAVAIPLTGYLAFAFAALGMLAKGVGGAGAGLLVVVVLGFPIILLCTVFEVLWMP